MEKYVSRKSAARYWKVQYLDEIFGTAGADELDAAHARVSCTFSDEALRARRCKTIESHVASKALPKGALVPDAQTGAKIASPELMFLELVPSLGFHRTLLLGLTLCGKSAAADKMPLTSAERIRKLLSKMRGRRGYKIASRAAKYLANDSASIMESLLYMLLALPQNYGGYGLSGASFNHRISLEGKDVSLKKRFVCADLYWTNAKLIIEYDSDLWHANENSWANDSKRITALQKLGYKTVSVTTAQLYDRSAFDEVAHVAAKHLGRRIRGRSARFAKAHKALRALLPKTSNRAAAVCEAGGKPQT